MVHVFKNLVRDLCLKAAVLLVFFLWLVKPLKSLSFRVCSEIRFSEGLCRIEASHLIHDAN